MGSIFDFENALRVPINRIYEFFGTLSTIRSKYNYRTRDSKTAAYLRGIEEQARSLSDHKEDDKLIRFVDYHQINLYKILNNLQSTMPQPMP